MEKELIKIYEDSDILAINKPSGLVVNRSNTSNAITLQDMIISSESIEESEEDEEFTSRSGIVHRLDKDTSGIMLIAKTPRSFENLQSQFKNRNVEKTYFALTYGTISQKDILIEAPIKRNPKSPLKYAVVSDGKEASTYIEVEKYIEESNQKFTYVKVYPKTGRTHQIRVHLGALNHFVVGDVIYCPKKLLEETPQKFNRLMLHAFSIKFNHPSTGKECFFTSVVPWEL